MLQTRQKSNETDFSRYSGRNICKELDLENQSGCMHFGAMRRREAEHQLEEVGAELRKLYSWNGKEKLIDN